MKAMVLKFYKYHTVGVLSVRTGDTFNYRLLYSFLYPELNGNALAATRVPGMPNKSLW